MASDLLILNSLVYISLHMLQDSARKFNVVKGSSDNYYDVMLYLISMPRNIKMAVSLDCFIYFFAWCVKWSKLILPFKIWMPFKIGAHPNIRNPIGFGIRASGSQPNIYLIFSATCHHPTCRQQLTSTANSSVQNQSWNLTWPYPRKPSQMPWDHPGMGELVQGPFLTTAATTTSPGVNHTVPRPRQVLFCQPEILPRLPNFAMNVATHLLCQTSGSAVSVV